MRFILQHRQHSKRLDHKATRPVLLMLPGPCCVEGSQSSEDLVSFYAHGFPPFSAPDMQMKSHSFNVCNAGKESPLRSCRYLAGSNSRILNCGIG